MYFDAKCLRDQWVYRCGAVLLCDETEGGLVVPHIPADLVGLERVAHIGDPAGAVLMRGEGAIDAEFTTPYGDVVPLAPILRQIDALLHAGDVPVTVAVRDQGLAPIQLISVDSVDQTVAALMTGRADFVFDDMTVLAGVIKQNPGKLKPTGELGPSQWIAMGDPS